jgi:hypothetical protein
VSWNWIKTRKLLLILAEVKTLTTAHTQHKPRNCLSCKVHQTSIHLHKTPWSRNKPMNHICLQRCKVTWSGRLAKILHMITPSGSRLWIYTFANYRYLIHGITPNIESKTRLLWNPRNGKSESWSANEPSDMPSVARMSTGTTYPERGGYRTTAEISLVCADGAALAEGQSEPEAP